MEVFPLGQKNEDDIITAKWKEVNKQEEKEKMILQHIGTIHS